MLGNVGSGKSACVVREMILNNSHRKTFSNIKTSKVKNNIMINKDMIMTKEVVRIMKNGTEICKYHLNKDFWKDTQEKEGAINVVLDEAHTLMNARRSGSAVNKVMGDFVALLRRILGTTDAGYGELTLITQLLRRIDVVARDMCTHVRYHVCHYNKTCKKCGCTWYENNENPEPAYNCKSCGSGQIKKHNHKIEVWHFKNVQLYLDWFEFGRKTYHKHYMVNDIEKYFPHYNTMQWENFISD